MKLAITIPGEKKKQELLQLLVLLTSSYRDGNSQGPFQLKWMVGVQRQSSGGG